MKKISLLLLFITLFSACNKETEEIEDATINANNSSITQRGGFTNNHTSTVTRFSAGKLEVYTYAIGKVFESDFPQTSFEFENYTYTNAVGQEVVNLKELLNGDAIFKAHFIAALQVMRLNNFGYQLPNGAPSPFMYPPVLPTANIGSNYNVITEELLGALYNGNIHDNIEIYMAKPIVSNVTTINTMHIASHPLTNASSTAGYIFKSRGILNSTATFNANFLNSHNENVLIVRPYRDTSHPYNDIPVSDFTLFYN